MENTPELQKDMLKGFEAFIYNNKELCEDTPNLMKFLPALMKLQNDKGRVYGQSYCRHKEFSIFLNTERKWDRISKIMERAMVEGLDTLYSDKSATPTETFVDTVVDLASYACLWATYIMVNHPEEFKKFLDNNNLSIE